MNIGFDAKRIFFNKSGLGNYGRNILSYLQDFYPENNYFLFSPRKNKKIHTELKSNSKVIEPVSTFVINSFWRSKGILKEKAFKNLDVYHGLSNELPIGISKTSVKSVLTVHDIIFVRFPELYKPFDRKIYLWKMKKACAEADKIIAISRQTKEDIVKYLGVKDSKIEIVYQGCNENFMKKSDTKKILELKEKYNLPEKYILTVGTIEERKNALMIVKALYLSKQDTSLIIVGRETPYAQKIKEFIDEKKMHNQVFLLNNVKFEELATLYQNCEIFIYPSFYEGFGIPIIEAFNSKVPVIVSDIDVFKEVANEAALFFENNNVESLTEKINLLLNDNKQRQKYIDLGTERAKFFRAENIANDLMKVYKKL